MPYQPITHGVICPNEQLAIWHYEDDIINS